MVSTQQLDVCFLADKFGSASPLAQMRATGECI